MVVLVYQKLLTCGLKLGRCDIRQEAFLDLMLPILNRTLRHFDAQTSAGGSRMPAVLRRRLRLLNKHRGAHELGVVFKVHSSCLPRLVRLLQNVLQVVLAQHVASLRSAQNLGAWKIL